MAVAVSTRGPRVVLRVLAGLMLASAVASAGPAPLHPGDRVVFLGDSITAGFQYTRFIESFVRLRHPELVLSFANVGIGGQTALDAVARLEHDVLQFKPTVVFVNFGMNDASYPLDSDHSKFEKNIATILDAVGRGGARVIWLSPTPFDVRGLPPRHADRTRQQRLVAYDAFVKAEGARRHLTTVPWQDVVAEALAAEDFRIDRKKHLLPDRVHPGDRMHAVMAVSALSALGFELPTAELSGEWARGKLTLRGAKSVIEAAWDGRSPLTVDVAGVRPPVPLLLDTPPHGRFGNVARELARLLFRVSGLEPTRSYRLETGGQVLGTYAGSALGAGVDLLANAARRVLPRGVPRPQAEWCARAEGNPFLNDYDCVHDLVRAKDQLRLSLRSDRAGVLPTIVSGRRERFMTEQAAWADEVDRELEALVSRTLAAPHRITITPL